MNYVYAPWIYVLCFMPFYSYSQESNPLIDAIRTVRQRRYKMECIATKYRNSFINDVLPAVGVVKMHDIRDALVAAIRSNNERDVMKKAVEAYLSASFDERRKIVGQLEAFLRQDHTSHRSRLNSFRFLMFKIIAQAQHNDTDNDLCRMYSEGMRMASNSTLTEMLYVSAQEKSDQPLSPRLKPGLRQIQHRLLRYGASRTFNNYVVNIPNEITFEPRIRCEKVHIPLYSLNNVLAFERDKKTNIVVCSTDISETKSNHPRLQPWKIRRPACGTNQ